MTRRRLTRQQQNRIRKRQQEAVETRPATPEELSTGTDEVRLEGTVICNFGQQLEVEALSGEQQGQTFRCFQRSNLPPLVCGDRVVFTPDQGEGGVILGLEERRNEFSRPASSGQLKPVAANIDLVLIVLAPLPQPFLNLVDRYLVALEQLGLAPLIIINKCELPEAKSDPVIACIQTDYPGLGYPVFSVSAHSGVGMGALKAALAGRTAVMVGQSGVGKSSLLNALDPLHTARVGELSSAADKGTHTTTAARLFHLDGCDLIDSPGIREFGLWHLSPAELLAGFIEFRPLLGHCRFRDCSHRDEPGCALREAVTQGTIKDYRLASYFQILDSL